MPDRLVFVKLGGSLITDKRHEATPRRAVIRRLARELHTALDAAPGLKIVMGHGSGSFGHWEAKRHATREGVETAEQWHGFARVSAAASRLNRIVVNAFLDADVPVLSLQPSAAALAEGGSIADYSDAHIRRALDHGLIPLIFGDVAFDRAWGGTILSTESLFVHLAHSLRPGRILLLGNASGVLNGDQAVIPHITPATYPTVAPHLHGSRYTDVTGGMADKVNQMIDLIQAVPGLRVWILTGREPGNLERALLYPGQDVGTRISAN